MSSFGLETKITSNKAGRFREQRQGTGWRAPGAKKRATPPITQQRSERSARTSTDFAVPAKGSARRLGPAASTSRCVGPGGVQSFSQSPRATRDLTHHTPDGLATQHLPPGPEADMTNRSSIPSREELAAMAVVSFLLAALLWGEVWVAALAEVIAQ